MRCLRCGREIGNKLEFSCGHFYRNNLSKAIVISKKKNNSFIIYLFTCFIIFLLLVLLIINNLNEDNNKNNEVCNIRCEGFSYKINNNKCECSNGMIYSIE